ncbi:YitT family protein [Mycoplasmopsis synoviae]|uniref:YitT family protein n=1 Tax=Mycoplasmopsis synoviae TaxID=2109 RepID=UPI0034DB11D0
MASLNRKKIEKTSNSTAKKTKEKSEKPKKLKDDFSINFHSKNQIQDNAFLENIEKVETQLSKSKIAKTLAARRGPFTFKKFCKNYWKKLFLIFLGALIFNLGIQVFLSRSETIPSGLTGVASLLQFSVPETKPYFAIIYFATNIPLFLIFWRKIQKKNFLYLTLIFMVFQILINFGLTLPQVEKFIHTVINFVSFDWTSTKAYEMNLTFLILLNCTIGAIFVAIGISLIWKAGGSTGGTDIIVYYYTTKYKKSIGNISVLVNIISGIIFVTIFNFLRPNVTQGEYPYPIVFGLREFSTFLYIFIVGQTINILYPKYKKVTLLIIPSDIHKVIAYFRLINYWHSYRIIKFRSGFTGNISYKIETTVLLLESKELIQDLKIVDPKVWITATTIHSQSGNFLTSYVEE